MKIYKDRVVGIVSVIIALILYSACKRLPESKVLGDPGSSLFPMIAAFVLLICGISLILRRPPENQKAFLLPFQWKRVFILFSIYLGYIVGLTFLGFLIATPIFMFILISVLAGAAQRKAGLIGKLFFSIGLTALMYLLFQVILTVRLPEGLII